MTADNRRSAERCPACDEPRLALAPDQRPDLRVARPYDELLAMGDPAVPFEPSIECLACGSSWPSLAAFRAAQRRSD